MTAPFEADFATMPVGLRYKLLAALVIPRPIALVTTVGPGGVVNAAPFSFFNVFSEDPALVILGLGARPQGGPKDTLAHVRETQAFVVNLVGEDIVGPMNTCAIDFPPDVSEIDAAGLTLLPGVSVPVPRIAEAPAALECRHYMTLEPAARRHLIIGEVVRVHARPGIVNAERLHVNLAAYKPVARLFGNLYARMGEVFELKRQSFAEWQADAEARAPRASGGAPQTDDAREDELVGSKSRG
jgi:flavin reductase (DIM6/NTAB) family NADH-FMN oxidoreductase RutF